jgi:hypothetical protein
MRKECWVLTTFELHNNKHSLTSLPSLVLIAIKHCTTFYGVSDLLQVHHCQQCSYMRRGGSRVLKGRKMDDIMNTINKI